MAFTDPHSFADLEQGRIKHIGFTLEVDFENKTIRGEAAYHLDRAVTGSFYMDTRDLKILGVRGGEGEEIAWDMGEEDKVMGKRLHLKNLPGQSRFTIAFETAPGASALQWLDPAQTAGGKHPYLFSQCQAIHARSVFPCQDSPSVRFTYSADVTVPAPLKAVMSAERTGVLEGEGTTTCRFEMPQAIPSYLFALAVGNLTQRDLGARSRIYAEPETIDDGAWEFAGTEQMITEAERLFGPYIWDRFDMLLMPPSFPYGGMENPRLTFLTPTLVVGNRSMVNVLVHELAHSWTGNLVTNATWEDFWLNEGWTVYAERRILEILEGVDYAQLQGVLRRNSMHADMKLFGVDSDPTRLNYSQKGIDPDDVFSTIPYEKGAALITLLEQAVGREVFDPFIRKYIDTFKLQSLTTKGFIAFLEKELPEAAAKVNVGEWIYEPGFPDNAPALESTLLRKVEDLVAAYGSGKTPAPADVEGFRAEQVELFLKKIPEAIPVEDCRVLEELFALKGSRNNNHLVAFYCTAIRSGHEEVLAGVETILSTVGRMLYLKPLYRTLVETEWSKPKARAILERNRSAYHPIAAGGIERILTEAGV
jgi:leukotriene-A4 hydrolase